MTGGGSILVFLAAPRDSIVQVASFFVPLLLSVGVLVLRVRSGSTSVKDPLLLLLAANVGYLVATLIWYLGPVTFDHPWPFPSFVDVMYFAVYATYAAFLLGVLRRRSKDRTAESRLALIDASILTVSMSALLWDAVIEPNLVNGTSVLSTSTAVMYPGFNLILFALAARLAVGSAVGRSAAGLLLLLWIGGEIAGNIFYGFQSANGSFAYGTPLSVTWMVSYSALAMLASHPDTVRLLEGSETPDRAGSEAATPLGMGRNARLAALLVAAVSTVVLAGTHGTTDLFLVGCSVVAVALVVYRTSLIAGDLHHERRLTAELHDMITQLGAHRDQLDTQARELEWLAFNDAITGLANRELLRERASAMGDSLETATLLLLDLDMFKEVNDALGHAAGDGLLVQVGDRLNRCRRTEDTVARLGGDEFAVLLPETRGAGAAYVAEQILAALREPFMLEGVMVEVRGSIGISCGASATDLDEMLRNADLAMYAAKGAGRDRACEFDQLMYEQATSRMELDTELRAAIAAEEFIAYYQPIVDAASGEIRSVEALVRWDHPGRGVLPPSEFLEEAERTGLIVELGRFVLRTACEQVVAWRLDSPELCLAVNVAHRELLHPDFVAHVTSVLDRTGLPPSALHLEITENVLADEESIERALEPLAALGVQFAIDDFGTGHSSLSRLRRLTVSRLKIDKSFIAEIGENGRGPDSASAPLLASIIALAHSVGLLVVAEGVETAEQASFLTAHRCDELQGYLYSRPVAGDKVPSVLSSTGFSTTAAKTEELWSPRIIARLTDSSEPLDPVLSALLRALTAMSGLQCCYITEILEGPSRQVARFVHNRNPEAPLVEAGAVVGVVRALGIETYIAVPVHDDRGRLYGTLCASSRENVDVDPSVVELMQLLVQAIAARLTGRATTIHGSSERAHRPEAG